MESVSVQSLIKWFKNFNPNKADSTYTGFKYGIINKFCNSFITTKIFNYI